MYLKSSRWIRAGSCSSGNRSTSHAKNREPEGLDPAFSIRNAPPTMRISHGPGQTTRSSVELVS